MTGNVEAHVPDAVSPPAGNPRFPAVDGLRALAALSVVTFHADQFTHAENTVLGRLASHLDVGVAIFFAITGFLLYRPFFAASIGQSPAVRARLFYWRRALRIIPGYWVALIVLAPVVTYATPDAIPNFSFIQIYRPAWVRSGIPPGWSVCVELSFYVLLPWFAAILHRTWAGLSIPKRKHRELFLLGAMALVSIILRALVHAFVHNLYAVDPLPTTFAWFCGGMGLAVLSVEPELPRPLGSLVRHPWRSWLLAMMIYAATLTTTQNTEQAGIPIFVAYGFVALFILAPLVFSPELFWAGRLALARPVAWLGLVSYGIYLYHYPLLAQIHPHTGSIELNFLILAVVGIAVAVTCGALSYYIVERPALRLKNVSRYPRVRRALKLGG
jgi:peptidoglycan/LPS O-acetylase OafA/YrhL